LPSYFFHPLFVSSYEGERNLTWIHELDHKPTTDINPINKSQILIINYKSTKKKILSDYFYLIYLYIYFSHMYLIYSTLYHLSFTFSSLSIKHNTGGTTGGDPSTNSLCSKFFLFKSKGITNVTNSFLSHNLSHRYKAIHVRLLFRTDAHVISCFS